MRWAFPAHRRVVVDPSPSGRGWLARARVDSHEQEFYDATIERMAGEKPAHAVDLAQPCKLEWAVTMTADEINMTADEIKAMIERGIPGARVEVRDTTGGGDHFEATVVSDGFEGKGLVERHQVVYAALGDAMRQAVHALALKTLTPAQERNRR
jgi:acid stress-induced BolA-like protein IbaG/YrbA